MRIIQKHNNIVFKYIYLYLLWLFALKSIAVILEQTSNLTNLKVYQNINNKL